MRNVNMIYASLDARRQI